jgi:hypothetical protein
MRSLPRFVQIQELEKTGGLLTPVPLIFVGDGERFGSYVHAQHLACGKPVENLAGEVRES